jgi:hypothetical protein
VQRGLVAEVESSRHIKITYLGQAMLYLHCPQKR